MIDTKGRKDDMVNNYCGQLFVSSGNLANDLRYCYIDLDQKDCLVMQQGFSSYESAMRNLMLHEDMDCSLVVDRTTSTKHTSILQN